MADDKQQLADDSEKPQEIKYQEEVHTPTLEEIMEEAADEEDAKLHGKPAEKPAEEVKPEEKPAETPVETPKVEEPKPQVIDEEKLTDNIATKLIDKLAPEDATKEEKKDLKAKLKELQAKVEGEGRELQYDEALEFLAGETKASVKEELKAELKDEVKQEVLKDLAKEVEDEEAKETKAREENDTRQKAWNAQWDVEFAQLESAGKLTKVDPKNITMDDNNLPTDPGRLERYHLLTQMQKYNIEHKDQPILNIVQFHALHFKSPTAKPDGATAPVAGARRAVTPQNSADFTNQEIHNTSIEDILAGK